MACHLPARCCRTTSGNRWSRRPATRSRISRKPGMHTTTSSRTCRRSCAPRACATSMGSVLQVTTNGVDPNNTFHYFLIAYGGQDIVTKDGRLHLDDPQVKAAVIKALTYPDHRLQGRLRAARRDQLERRRRQQRVPLQADRDRSRRHDLDRGRHHQEQGRLQRHCHDGPAAEQRGQAGAEPAYRGQRDDSAGREECRCGQGFPEILHPAEGQQRVAEGRARPQHPGHAVDCQERPVVARRPASQGLYRTRRARPDRAGLLGVQSGLCPRCRTSMSGAPPGPTS